MDGEGFSDDEVTAILRRATELDARGGSDVGAWGLPQIEEVGAEVGISPDAVRRAAAEMQLAAEEATIDLQQVSDRKVVSVVAARVVPLPSERVTNELHNWLVARGFRIVRQRRGATSWRHADLGRAERKALAGVKLRAAEAISLVVAPAGEGASVVRFRVDLPADRAARAGRQARDGVFMAGVAGWLGASWLGHGVVAVGVAIAGGWLGVAFARSWFNLRSSDRRARREVTLEVEGALDRLELGQLGP